MQLAWRAPWQELLDPAVEPRTSEVLTLLFGVLGVATAAFQWSSSPWYVEVKLALAEWLIERGHDWPLSDGAPWWVLTHVPAANDVFTWLDGGLILGYLQGGGLLLGSLLALSVALANVASGGVAGFGRLALALTPLGAASIILGLSMLTIGHLRAEHVAIPWLAWPRIALFGAGSLFSMGLAWRLVRGARPARRVAGLIAFSAAPVLMGAVWYLVFFVW